MKLLAVALLLLCPLAHAARTPLPYLRAQNFRLSQARSLEDWIFLPRDAGPARVRGEIFFGRESGVGPLYDDITSKNSARLTNRLEGSFGEVFDVAAKAGGEISFGAFRQRFAVNAAISLAVNDPVFPELSGILFNDFSLSSEYAFLLDGWRLRPFLTYGVRRSMSRSFTVGQLVDQKPNLRLKAEPYRFFSELSLDGEKRFRWGDLVLNVDSLPLYQRDFDYWQVELGYRSPELLPASRDRWLSSVRLAAFASPLYGGDYSFVRTVRSGVTTRWGQFLKIDVSFADKFLPAALVRLGPEAWNLQIYTFARAEDDQHVFTARQYGLALAGRF